MKKSLLSLAVASALSALGIVRQRTHDVSIAFRMGAGFPGEVNRTHPFHIMPGLINRTTPPRLYGDPVRIDTASNSYMGYTLGDTQTAIDGVAVRPYPTQQTSGGMTATIGTGGVPSLDQPLDVISDGVVLVKVNNGGTPTKKGAVFVWIAASSGNHVQGGFESVTGGASTLQITNAFFNGPPDANGITEMVISRVSI